MNVIRISPEEVAAGAPSTEHLGLAARAIRDDGFVVLTELIDPGHLDALRERMLEDIRRLLARPNAPFNWNPGNLQQDPPPFPPYLFRDVLLNDVVIAVTRSLLGPGVKNVMYSGNTSLPGPDRQPVHADVPHLWPDQEVAHPAAQLVVNVPVVDMSAENGSTEIWPGTHRDLTIVAGRDIKIPSDALEARRAVRPPIQPSVKRGGVVIRDIRLWHAGMPNRSTEPRPMIAMIHSCGWLDTGDPLVFPREAEPFFRHPILRTCARFVDAPIDYIAAPHAYEYDSEGIKPPST